MAGNPLCVCRVITDGSWQLARWWCIAWQQPISCRKPITLWRHRGLGYWGNTAGTCVVVCVQPTLLHEGVVPVCVVTVCVPRVAWVRG